MIGMKGDGKGINHMKKKVLEGGGKGGLRAKQETQRGGRGRGRAGEGGGGRRKCGGNKQGLNDKEIMVTVLLPSSTHRNRPNFIYTLVFMTLKPPDCIISDRWCSKKKLGRYTIYTQ
jgi:hypothetical protein